MPIVSALRNLNTELVEGMEALRKERDWKEELDKVFTRMEPSPPVELTSNKETE